MRVQPSKNIYISKVAHRKCRQCGTTKTEVYAAYEYQHVRRYHMQDICTQCVDQLLNTCIIYINREQRNITLVGEIPPMLSTLQQQIHTAYSDMLERKAA